MSDRYEQLLSATIQYLEDLKSRGASSVAAAPDTIKLLASSQRVQSASGATATLNPSTLQPFNPPAGAALASPPLAGEARVQAMAELRARALACVKCPHLVTSRKNIVFGVGNIEASLMFVGEAPGADEDQQGEPFVGAAGQLLTRMIQAMGFARDSVYIANILKCRPDTPGQAYGNRKPTPDEMQTCISWLHEQIDLIRPKVLVGLGATAIEGLLGKTAGITRLRGNWHSYRSIPLMPTYHPAYLLRNQAISEKRRVWEDLMQVMEKLELPISQKQRGYFLNKQ
ncbi:MAG: uracil-DNA glycosylase [Verrucomicrobia subdivision 3 bacterium]|nr:uracil-DNA glycosylase [Limisphaerales bacterium]